MTSRSTFFIILGIIILIIISAYVLGYAGPLGKYTVLSSHGTDPHATTTAPLSSATATTIPLDITAYNAKLKQLANEPPPRLIKPATSSTPAVYATTTPLWPVKAAYPDGGALLPFNRIVAYYGNFYSTQMGVLGQYPPDQMIAMLASTTAQWKVADPSTPVIPALDYIVVTAQGSAGTDGKYRLRMPDSQIDKALSLIQPMNGLVFLDFQVGLSNVETEVPLYAKYLAMPNVELSLDPEFDMSDGARPDTEIGSMSAADINWAANYLANLVKQNNLPPKILVVHRFTQDMVTNYKNVAPLPQVQVVMDMDGWGSQAKKINSYNDFIADEPVQFTGIKLFYKNDLLPPSTGMLTPHQVLNLTPRPSYIQYQ